MHIPDGIISHSINASTAVASAAVCGVALWKAERELGERQVPLLGVTAAFVFAAQMLQFPVGGGTSGHFMGGALAAILLGPLRAVLVMAIVLGIQFLAFADGGLTALGTNIFNLGIVGAAGAWIVFWPLKSVLPRTRAAFCGAAAVAAWISVVAAATACSLELVLSGVSPLRAVLPAMVGVHAVIGLGEAIITGMVVSVVLASRPDLVGSWSGGPVPAVAAEGSS